LLPAVQRAREAANRSRCASNLRQLALAFHVYNTDNGRLPSAGAFSSKVSQLWNSPQTSWNQNRPTVPSQILLPTGGFQPMPGSGSASDQYLGWGYQILPFIDQEYLHESFDPTRPVPVYYCPSRRKPQANGASSPVAQTDYAGNAGPFWASSTPPREDELKGMLKPNVVIGLLQPPNNSFFDTWSTTGAAMSYTDSSGQVRVFKYQKLTIDEPALRRKGISNVILLAEKALSPQDIGQDAAGDSGYYAGYHISSVRTAQNQPTPDYQTPQNSTLGNFGAAHTGSFNAVMGDQSIRRIRYTVNLNTLQLISKRMVDSGDPHIPWEEIEP
jgi:hypothetical protein